MKIDELGGARPQEESNVPVGASSEQPTVPWGWLRAVLFILGYLVLSLLMAVVTVFVFGASSEKDVYELMSTPEGVVLQLITFVATLGLVWLFRFGLDRRSLVSLGFSFDSGARRDLRAGILWGVGLISFVFLVLLVSGQIEVTELAFPVEALAIQAALAILVALTEELTMRGYLLNNLMKSANRYLALVLVSVIFALFHGFNPGLSWVGLLNIVLAGLLLGIYYVHRKNLWFPIGLHFAWNLFQGAVYGASVSGLKFESIISFDPSARELMTGGDFGFEASIVTTFVMIAATLILHVKYRSGSQSAGGSESPSDPASGASSPLSSQ